MGKIKIVQIGIGHDHACDALDCLLNLTEEFEVLGLAVPDEENEKFKSKIDSFCNGRGVKLLSIKEALSSGASAAAIETEERNLTDYAILAAEQGMHIHMDKPGGFSYEKFKELVELLESKSLAFSVGYMYRFNPYIMEAVKKAENGELGRIYSIEANMSCEHPKEKREWLKGLPGGMLFFLGCHLIDVVFKIQGMPKEIIPCNASVNGVSEDFGMVVFKYENGCSFVKTSAIEPGGFMRRQIVICGDKGTIELKPLEEHDFSVKGRRGISTTMRECHANNGWLEDGVTTHAERFNRYDSMMTSFADVVNGKRGSPYSYEYELELYSLIMRSCNQKI